MGKGDIRTRRGKVWRGTYGVSRPRRYKTVIRPAVTSRKSKSLKDISKIAGEATAETIQEELVTASDAETASADATEKKPVVKKTPAAKKAAVKKAPAKKE
jgi:30S ribosomal protein S31